MPHFTSTGDPDRNACHEEEPRERCVREVEQSPVRRRFPRSGRGVDRDVEHPRERADGEERHEQPQRGRGESRQHRGSGEEDEKGGDRSLRVAIVDTAHDEHRRQRSETDTEQREPERRIGAADGVLDVGQDRGPPSPEHSEDPEREHEAPGSTIDGATPVGGGVPRSQLYQSRAPRWSLSNSG